MARLGLVMLHLGAYGSAWLMLASQRSLWVVLLAGTLIWISTEDFISTEIPDVASGLLIATAASWLLLSPPAGMLDHVVGAVFWPLLTWTVAYSYAWLRGWSGLGFGDVKLMVGIGLWAGFSATIWIVMAASLAGIVTILAATVMRRQPLDEIGTSAIAFGPFLCLSTWIVVLKRGLL